MPEQEPERQYVLTRCYDPRTGQQSFESWAFESKDDPNWLLLELYCTGLQGLGCTVEAMV